MSSEENVERFRILRAGLKRDIDENLTSLQEELEKEDPSKVKLSFGLSHLRDDEKELRGMNQAIQNLLCAEDLSKEYYLEEDISKR